MVYCFTLSWWKMVQERRGIWERRRFRLETFFAFVLLVWTDRKLTIIICLSVFSFQYTEIIRPGQGGALVQPPVGLGWGNEHGRATTLHQNTAGSLVRRKIWDLMWSPLNATLETAQVSQCLSRSWSIVVGNIENMLSSVMFIHRGSISSFCHGVFFLDLKLFSH